MRWYEQVRDRLMAFLFAQVILLSVMLATLLLIGFTK